MLAAHLVVGDLAVFVHNQFVAENGGPTQLLHQGLCELGEGVGDDDHLGDGAQFVQELAGAGHGIDGGDGVLDLLQTQAVLFQDVQTELHELVVVGFVAGGAGEFGDAGCLGEFDPDFGNQYSFEVQAYDVHVIPPHFVMPANRALPRLTAQ